jgi:hypothetical protein
MWSGLQPLARWNERLEAGTAQADPRAPDRLLPGLLQGDESMKTITVKVSEVRVGDILNGQAVTKVTQMTLRSIKFHHQFGSYTLLGLAEPGCPGREAVTTVERAEDTQG